MSELKAEPREILGKKVKKLRQAGYIPAVLYGHGKKNQNISVEEKSFGRVLEEVGETTLVTLKTGGKNYNVLIHDVDRDPLRGNVRHIDFYEVRMDEKIKADVPLVFIGASEAVKNDGGILVKSLQAVEVEALPRDLPKEIAVDISGLDSFEAKIHIGDLKVSAGVKILANPAEIVAFVAPPRSDKEMAELEGKAEEKAPEPEVVGEAQKKEDLGEPAGQ